jgi:hypothetical protein
VLAATAAATAANLIIPDNREIPGNEVFHNGPYIRPDSIVIDINARLPESHEWPHADAANNQGIHTLLCQNVDRDHTSSLYVALVLDRGDLFNFSVFNIYQGEHVAMTKMS